MKTLAIIDGDGLAFHSLRESLEDSLKALDDKMHNLFTKTQADEYMIFISKGKYFRHDVFPDYKKPREAQRDRLSYVRTLKAVLEDRFGAKWMYKIEADDLCAYFYRSEHYSDGYIKILCTPDKDLLKGIPSNNPQGHFNYSYKSTENESTIKGWWITTTPEEAEESFWTSMIAGDTTDGIPGIYRKGPAFCKKLFEALEIKGTFMEAVFKVYIEEYGVSKGIYEFQKHYRLLRLLQTDNEFLQEVGELPINCNIVYEVPDFLRPQQELTF